MSFYISNVFDWDPLGSGKLKFWYDTIRDIFNMTIYLLPIPTVVERFYAAVYANVYENYFSLTFVIVLCATSVSALEPLKNEWLASIWLTVHLTWFNEVLNVFYIYLIFNAVTIGSYVLYFAYYYYQKSKITTSNGTSSLSERYQRVENQACSQTILGFAIVSTIIDILAVLHNVFALYYLPDFFPEVMLSDKVAFFRTLLTISTSLVLLALPRYFVYINATLWRRYNKTFFKCTKENQVGTSSDTGIQIKSISGNLNLVMPDETNYYFESLEKQWNNNLDSKITKAKTT
uniref:Serpentine receptor class gamma n=1 Tax=Panagrellus redivivus TaxID=6233 RepID=A0A7E4VYI2_PANRE